jgi:signal transduction histidine kinase
MTDGRPPRSLLVRTTTVLAAALVLFFGALVLVVRPLLAGAFETRGAEMLREAEMRAQNDARRHDVEVGDALAARTAKARETAAAAALDAPFELVTKDADQVRALLDARLRRAAAGEAASVRPLAEELQARSEARFAEQSARSDARNETQAKAFGDELGWRAASVLLGMSAVLFLVHGVLLWRSVLAPVARLSEATQVVAKGRLEVRLPVKGDDEVARLAANFNAMTASLEKAQADLVALNASLEDRVREKSAALVQAEGDLRRAEKMASLGTLAGGVAHEFGNLLGGIQGCAEDAALETDPAEIKETLAVIERTARRGTAITDKLLRFARPAKAGRDQVDVAAALRDVATLVQPEASRSGVVVHVEAPAEASVLADPTGVHQVMLNLATNALHAMPEGGSLTMSVTQTADEVAIRVADTGVGISPENRAKLFEPFFTTRPEGTGLGLSVTYAIVKAHGGRIDVVSSPGRGASFTVTWPVHPPEGGAA